MSGQFFANLDSLAVVCTDEHGYIAAWSRQAKRLFGYGDEDVLGKHVSLLDAPFGVGTAEKLVQQAREVGCCGTEQTWQCHDGRSVRAEAAVFVLSSSPGQRQLVFLFAESGMESGSRQLSYEKERLASIGAAAPALAHQLGNPLNGISATVQLLEHFLSSSDPPPIQPMLASVRDLKAEVQRLTVLLNGFKSLAGNEALALAPIEVAWLVQAAIRGVESDCERQNIQVSIACEADLPRLNGDAEKLLRAMSCVLENAVEAMPKGGQLQIRAYRRAEILGIAIADTGGGIPPGIRPFDPFSSTKADRTGLGLFTAQQIVRAHNGMIDSTSAPGQGTTIQFSFPCGGASGRGE